MARVLQNLGSTEVMVVHGMDGLDEITVADRTKISHLKDGKIRTYFIEPKDFRMNRCAKEELLGGSVNENIKITNDILKGTEKAAKRDIVLLSTAAALVVEKAKESIDSGKAFKKLEELIKFTNS
jgi:anthranilate phosphoribosyltransferase